jgi:replication factor C subunit 1
MNINNTSLDGFLQGASVSTPYSDDSCTLMERSAQTTNSFGVTITDKTCLIMDEVDGMSAGDRGGVGALNAMIKKSKVMLDHVRYGLY